jgi:hypothetical protein
LYLSSDLSEMHWIIWDCIVGDAAQLFAAHRQNFAALKGNRRARAVHFHTERLKNCHFRTFSMVYIGTREGAVVVSSVKPLWLTHRRRTGS